MSCRRTRGRQNGMRARRTSASSGAVRSADKERNVGTEDAFTRVARTHRHLQLSLRDHLDHSAVQENTFREQTIEAHCCDFVYIFIRMIKKTQSTACGGMP